MSCSPGSERSPEASPPDSPAVLPVPPSPLLKSVSVAGGALGRRGSESSLQSDVDLDGNRLNPSDIDDSSSSSSSSSSSNSDGGDGNSDPGTKQGSAAPGGEETKLGRESRQVQEFDLRRTVLARRNSAASTSSVFGSGPRTMLLNPPDEYVLQAGDQVLVIAEDDDTYVASEEETPCEAALRARNSVTSQHPMHTTRHPERLLFCGWRRDMDDMISSLDRLVHKGSELHLMCTVPVRTRLKRFREANKVDLNNLQNLRIIHERGNPVLRRHLESLDLENFSSILILADEAVETNMQTADSRSLASLLLIRDIIKKRHAAGMTSSSVPPLRASLSAPHMDRSEGQSSDGETSTVSGRSEAFSINNTGGEKGGSPRRRGLPRRGTEQDRLAIRRSWCPREHKSELQERSTTIISEILDSRTKSLISVAQVSDYVMSNEIVACAMAMVAEDRSINTVLTELLSASGSEIQVISCLQYCEPGERLDFWTMMARARKRSEIAIGYKPATVLAASNSADDWEAVINPRNKSRIRTWRRGDTIVVLTTSA